MGGVHLGEESDIPLALHILQGDEGIRLAPAVVELADPGDQPAHPQRGPRLLAVELAQRRGKVRQIADKRVQGMAGYIEP